MKLPFLRYERTPIKWRGITVDVTAEQAEEFGLKPGRKRLNICAECDLGPCLKGKPRCQTPIAQAVFGPGQGVAFTDWYSDPQNDAISIEGAAETEFDLKEQLDGDVDYENEHGSAPHERQAPCRRRKGSVHS